MPTKETVGRYLRILLRAVAVYAAGAWVAIEVVDFAVRQYGLSQFLVDAAVVVAFGGGMVTAVLVWFHGASGRQRIRVAEVLVICGIVIATASVLFYLVSASPTKEFDSLPGYRLVLEFRFSGQSDTEDFHISMSPMESTKGIPGGMLNLAPEDGHIRGPIIQAQFEGHPALFVDSPDSDFVRVVFVLPYEPTDLSELIALGSTHDSATINTDGLSIEIQSNISIQRQASGTTIQLVHALGQPVEKL